MDKRMEQFILMLGSDQPGEVVNAAGMLVKALRKQGRDLHTLVKQLDGVVEPRKPLFDDAFRLQNELAAAKATIRVLQQKIDQLNKRIDELASKPPKPDPPYGRPKMSGDGWRAQAEWALAFGWGLKLINEREFDFLTDMTHRPKHYDPSYRQLSWLQDIFDRLRRVEAAADR